MIINGVFASKDEFEGIWVYGFKGMERGKWGCLFQGTKRWKWRDSKVRFVKIYELYDRCD